jgi:filamentous hemagglutinin family protein
MRILSMVFSWGGSPMATTKAWLPIPALSWGVFFCLVGAVAFCGEPGQSSIDPATYLQTAPTTQRCMADAPRSADAAQRQNSGVVTDILVPANGIVSLSTLYVAEGDTVNFVVPEGVRRPLIRIDGPDPCVVNGTITVNGEAPVGPVYLVNPAGIVFGPRSVVNVESFQSTAANIAGPSSPRIVNQGVIEIQSTKMAEDGVVRIGGLVQNTGRIVSEAGVVTMSSGNEVFLAEGGSRIASLDATESEPSATEAMPDTVVFGSGDIYDLSMVSLESVCRGRENKRGPWECSLEAVIGDLLWITNSDPIERRGAASEVQRAPLGEELFGYIVDADGNPLAGAQITPTRSKIDNFTTSSTPVKSQRDGWFCLRPADWGSPTYLNITYIYPYPNRYFLYTVTSGTQTIPSTFMNVSLAGFNNGDTIVLNWSKN